MATLFGVQYTDGSAATVQDLERAKAIVSYDPTRRKVVKLTVEDYVPPKKYKWTVENTYERCGDLSKMVNRYEGVCNTRAEAERKAKIYAAASGGVQVSTVEEIDG